MRKIVQILCTFFVSSTVFCQTASKPSLPINSFVPQLTSENTVNGSNVKLSLDDYKGKLILLDFWATWCSPCVASFPLLDSIQKENAKDLKIISISDEPKQIVETFMKSLLSQKKVSPVSIYADTLFNKTFRPNGGLIPHYVWINKEGRYIASTASISRDDVRSVLNNNLKGLVQKVESEVVLNSYNPIFLIQPQIKLDKGDTLMYKEDDYHTTILTKYMQELRAGATYFNVGRDGMVDNRILIKNSTVLNLFRRVYGKRNPQLSDPSRVIIELADSSKLHSIGTDILFYEGNYDRLYCLEVRLKDSENDDPVSVKTLEFAQKDLNEYFLKNGFQVKQETRKRDILKLIRFDTTIDLSSKTNELPDIQKNMLYYKAKNSTSSELVNVLRGYYWQENKNMPPLIDGTGYKKHIDISIETKMSDFDSVSKELEKLGLKIVKEQIELPYTVFYEVYK